MILDSLVRCLGWLVDQHRVSTAPRVVEKCEESQILNAAGDDSSVTERDR